MEIDKRKVVQKWSPIIEKMFEYKNIYLNDIICIFCEMYTIQNETSQDRLLMLPQILKDIKNKIENLDKIEIVKSFYNPINGKIEHILKNGLSVNEFGIIKDFSEELYIDLFKELGLDIFKEIDLTGFREGRINEILK